LLVGVVFAGDEGAVADELGLGRQDVSADGVGPGLFGVVDGCLDDEQRVGDLVGPAPVVGSGGVAALFVVLGHGGELS
jgi:hypothetical protein